ncbi:MAG: YiiD C-terminal domain-containing protein [Pseudomonadota bacterium]|nr:hypothetical protein [Pseudomonadales bacterium]MDY6921153.1 YiiD C-terminal domain-containing protein [Pseudomonadota bacterium]
MTHLDQVRRKLQEQVPLIRHMGVEVVSWDGATVVVEAPLEPNLNTHGTAFGGSLYCVGAMTGWSALHLTLMDAGHHPSVWVAKGEVVYLKPVRGILRATATITPQQRDNILQAYANKGRTKTLIDIVIKQGDDDAMTLTATYAARRPEDE